MKIRSPWIEALRLTLRTLAKAGAPTDELLRIRDALRLRRAFVSREQPKKVGRKQSSIQFSSN